MKPIRVALIPAYEPDETLAKIVHELSLRDFFIVVVNDGSSVACDMLFEDISGSAVVLKHPENCGKGAALRTGLAYLREHFPFHYTVVTLDADGQHRICDAERVCREAEEHPGTLALGTRDFKGKVPLRSRIGNLVTSLVFWATNGVRVRDTQTGLRAFTDSLVEEMTAVSGDRYEYEMNVLTYCTHKKIPINQVRIKTLYYDGNATSHFDPVKDSVRIYRELLKFSLSSLACFLLDYALFCVLLGVTGSEVIANVIARVISAGANYTINRFLVFRDDQSMMKTAAQYFALAVGILLCNTALLWTFVNVLHLNSYAAKLLTEVILFVVSWTVQRLIIFKKKPASQG